MSSAENRSTPGVYITEANAFPNAIPGAPTAVPAFIGYTERALIDGKPVYFEPVTIRSLADYQAIFGDRFMQSYTFEHVGASASPPAPGDCDFSAETWIADGASPTQGSYEPRCYRIVPATIIAAGFERATVPPNMAAFNLCESVRLFYANGGGACSICSVGPYSTDGAALADIEKGLAAVGAQSGPTMLVVPDAVLLPQRSDFASLCRQMLAQCRQSGDRVAILDVYGTQTLNGLPASEGLDAAVKTLIADFQEDVGDDFLNYGVAYFPFLATSIVQPSDLTYLCLTPSSELKRILTDEASCLHPDPAAPDPDNNENPTYTQLRGLIDRIGTTTADDGPVAVASLDQNLVEALPILRRMKEIVASKVSLLPASGAMAGLYTMNDASRGVWNAPANLAVTSVTGPSVTIDAEMQELIITPVNGKAVNVIRSFPGRGTVVWGARTLDGNSNDWRYIQVRRTILYIETSIKAALNQFVFAPNNGTTWIAATAMVSGFLTGLWQQGGLMGAKADEAFTVQCGLGSTMTGTDVLDGYMIVQVAAQMIRPAEFIELTFKQKMEGVA